MRCLLVCCCRADLDGKLSVFFFRFAFLVSGLRSAVAEFVVFVASSAFWGGGEKMK